MWTPAQIMIPLITDDLVSLSEFDESHKAIGIRLHGRVNEVKFDNVREEVSEEENISRDTVGKFSHKEEKENDPDGSQPILKRLVEGFTTAKRLFNIIVGGDVPEKNFVSGCHGAFGIKPHLL